MPFVCGENEAIYRLNKQRSNKICIYSVYAKNMLQDLATGFIGIDCQ